MGIRPTEPVIRPAGEPAVRHVEPKSDSQKFREKEQPDDERHRRSGQQATSSQDEVVVSEQYQAKDKDTQTPLVEELPIAPDSPASERHVDIKA